MIRSSNSLRIIRRQDRVLDPKFIVKTGKPEAISKTMVRFIVVGYGRRTTEVTTLRFDGDGFLHFFPWPSIDERRSLILATLL
jgi:hypothetical protein